MKKHNDAAKRRLPNKAAPIPAKVVIRKIPNGVKGLDDILGGGIPEFSFNIIAGTPGRGKTTLAHQIVFANATAKKPALLTILGEPAMKMLRYQQQYSFFDDAQLGTAIRFINLADVVMEKDLDAVFDAISAQVAAMNPSIVVVDSFRTVVRKAISGASEFQMQAFIQRLAQFLTSWQATTFLVGEYVHDEIRDKMRGCNHSKDIREYVITDKGVVVISPRSTEYEGLTTGLPARTGPGMAQNQEAAPEPKAKK